jgi:hypothetical protein
MRLHVTAIAENPEPYHNDIIDQRILLMAQEPP